MLFFSSAFKLLYFKLMSGYLSYEPPPVIIANVAH